MSLFQAPRNCGAVELFFEKKYTTMIQKQLERVNL
jgi:hypothetical protein